MGRHLTICLSELEWVRSRRYKVLFLYALNKIEWTRLFLNLYMVWGEIHRREVKMMFLNGNWKDKLNQNYVLLLFIVVLFWLKTYAVYRFEFQLGIENGMQQFLLFINPLSSALFFFGIALFFNGRRRY